MVSSEHNQRASALRSTWTKVLEVVGSAALGAVCLCVVEVVMMVVRGDAALSGANLWVALSVATMVGAGLGAMLGMAVSLLLAWRPALWPTSRLGVLAVVAAAVGWTIDAYIFVNLYPHAHTLVGWGTLAMAVLAGLALTPRRPALGGLALVLGIAGLLAIPWLVAGEHVLRQALVSHSHLVGRTLLSLPTRETKGPDGACIWPPASPVQTRGAARGASVLLVTIDAFRGDLGGDALANALPKTLERLPRAIRLDRAHAAAPRTTYSTYSMLTGVLPHRLGFVPATTDVDDRFIPLADDDPIMLDPSQWKLRHRYPLQDNTPTLAGILSAEGYASAAVVADVCLLPAAGITRQFERVDDAPYQSVGRRDQGGTTSVQTTETAIAWLDGIPAQKPWFSWLHYRDPHHPYDAFGPVPEDAPEPTRYFSEIRRVDAQLARLLDHLETTGRLQQTIVVITGDHGEEFRDHGGRFHGTTLYQELIHVPLVLQVPGVGPAAWTEQPVSLTDLVPTLLDLLGVEPEHAFDGHSFAGLLTGRPWSARPLFAFNTSYTAEHERQGAIILGWWKYIEDEAKGTRQLYDLASDPHERENLVQAQADRAEELRCLLWGAGAFSSP